MKYFHANCHALDVLVGMRDRINRLVFTGRRTADSLTGLSTVTVTPLHNTKSVRVVTPNLLANLTQKGGQVRAVTGMVLNVERLSQPRTLRLRPRALQIQVQVQNLSSLGTYVSFS